MWTVVYVGQSREAADKLKALLEDAGILVRIRPVTGTSEGDANAFEILIPQTEKEEADKIIIGSQI